jgi:hypothetical protein
MNIKWGGWEVLRPLAFLEVSGVLLLIWIELEVEKC